MRIDNGDRYYFVPRFVIFDRSNAIIATLCLNEQKGEILSPFFELFHYFRTSGNHLMHPTRYIIGGIQMEKRLAN